MSRHVTSSDMMWCGVMSSHVTSRHAMSSNEITTHTKHSRQPFSLLTCRIQNPDTLRAGRIGAAHGEAARWGGAGKDGTLSGRSGQKTTHPLALQRIEDTVLDVSSEARTKEILCKPMEEQNPRLTTGSSAVCKRFISGTRSALHSWNLD